MSTALNNQNAEILVVDDNQANLTAMKALLSQVDAEVVLAESGNQALSLSLQHHFALILLDVQMPEMDGYEVADILRGEEKTHKIPIIFVTAIHTSEENRLKGYDSGAVDYILKPVQNEVLLSKVNVFLQLWQQKQSLISEIEARKRADKFSQLLLNSTSEGFFGISPQGICTFINPAAEKILGYDSQEMVGKKTHPIIHHSHEDGSHYPVEECPMCICSQTGQRSTIDNEVLWHKNGHSIFVEYSTAPIINHGVIDGAVVNFRDISERHREKSRLQYKALHDVLTGLPNRNSLYSYLNNAMARTFRSKQLLAMLFFDLDGFKGINDNYGHESGDVVLKTLGERLIKTSRKSDFVARIGGDEFICVLESFHDETEVTLVSERILETVNQPIEWNNHMLTLGCSIGIAYYPENADSIDEWIKKADTAMYQAKQSGKNTYVFYRQ